jgi:CHASE3 domain sensor protein
LLSRPVSVFYGAMNYGRGLWRLIQHPTSAGVALLFLCSNIAIVGLTAISWDSFQRRERVMEQMRDSTRSLLIGILNAETGVRGYIITGNFVYLTPYQVASDEIPNQIKHLKSLPLDANQRDDANQLISQTTAQMQRLGGLVEVRRTSGRSAAGLRIGSGEEKLGLDSLRASIDNTIDALSTSMLGLKRISDIYQEAETWCVIFAGFWLFLIILITVRKSE